MVITVGHIAERSWVRSLALRTLCVCARSPIAGVGTCGCSSFLPQPKEMCISRTNYGTASANVFLLFFLSGSVINPGTGYKTTQEAVVENETKHLKVLNTNGLVKANKHTRTHLQIKQKQ